MLLQSKSNPKSITNKRIYIVKVRHLTGHYYRMLELKTPITALVATRDPEEATHLRELLQTESSTLRITCETVPTVEAAHRRLSETKVDVALIDLHLSEGNGLDTISSIAEKFSSIPVIALIDQANPKLEEAIFKGGAQDILVKCTANRELLTRAARYAVQYRRTRIELEETRKLAQLRANYDPLTGLPNRDLFHDRLLQAIATAKREQRLVGVLLLDLDRFKLINDSLSHVNGDQVLKVVSDRLRALLREVDTVARLGGDEFAVILSNIRSERSAATVAKKILYSLSRELLVENHRLFATSSIGISLFPGDGEDPQTLIRNAEVALYQAKNDGGHSYRFYHADMNAKAFEQMLMESHLREAIKNNEFFLHFQPQLNLRSGRIIGMEALIRWQNPTYGIVSPMDFIPLAEETGLIVPIGTWVLQTACQHTKQWHEAGFNDLHVAVNISGRQFQDELEERIHAVVETTGLDPSFLELEITESVLMKELDNAATTLQNLHAQGLKISIDDFGTGYSSLNYLKKFPIEKLKIDRTFVKNLTADSSDRAITEAIIAMARSLKLKTVAEGVETEAHLKILQALNCDEMQGFYFSKPLAAREFTDLLSSGRDLVSLAI